MKLLMLSAYAIVTLCTPMAACGRAEVMPDQNRPALLVCPSDGGPCQRTDSIECLDPHNTDVRCKTEQRADATVTKCACFAPSGG